MYNCCHGDPPPPRCRADLEWWFPGDVRDEEVHSNVLAVHVLVHHLSYLLGLPVGVQVGVVLGRRRRGEVEEGEEEEEEEE